MPTTYDLGVELSRFEEEDNVFIGLIETATADKEYYIAFGKCANPKLTENKMYTFANKETFSMTTIDADINIKLFNYHDCMFKMVKLDKKEDYNIVKRAVFAALK